MTISQLGRVLRAQWYLVVAVTLLVTGGAVAFTVSRPVLYEAGVQMFVSTGGVSESDASQLNQGGIFTQQRVKSYAALVTSPQVLDPVIAGLGLRTTAARLGERITATAQVDTVLLDVTVQDESPLRARDIANAIAAAFPALIQGLETPAGQTRSPVKISVTRQAVTPDAPVLPRTRLNIALGVLAGLLLGIAAGVVRNALDRRLRTREQALAAVRAPVLGAVVQDRTAAARPLVADQDATPRAEAFRHLRTNIRFLSVDRQIGSFVVTSSLPGEGKTTTAANLATVLAQAGQAVVLVDADLRRPTVADTFGISGSVGLSTVLLGEVPVSAAMQQWRPDLPLFVLPAGPNPPNPSELLASGRLTAMIAHLRRTGLVVIFDSPPLLPVTDAVVLARATDGAVLVARMGRTHVEQLAAAAETLRSATAPILGLVLNRVRRTRKQHAYAGYTSAPVTLPRQASKGRARVGTPVSGSERR